MKATTWKLGLSTCATESLDRIFFDTYAENGIQVMEISLPTQMYPQIDWKTAKKDALETNVEIRSIHLPFYPFESNNIADPDAEIRKKSIEAQTELIKRAADIGTQIAVIHPSGEPNPAEERKERLLYARESLAILAENASKCGSTVAVENLPRTCLGNCIEEMRYLTDIHENLRICFDTNHLLLEKNADFIKALGDRFITIHVSDYDFLDEKHWLPYEGKTDWVELVTLLEEVGYCGPFLYEVPRRIPRTLNRRELTFADYRVNYEACVQKRVAPKII